MAEYNPFKDFNPAFTKYEYLEPKPQTYNDPLFGELSVNGFNILPNGNWVAPTNQKQKETQSYYDTSFLDEMAARHSENSSGTKIPSDSENFEGGALIDNEKFAYDYLVKNKIPKGTAAGVVGNLYHEGLANPTKSNKDSHGTTSYGIAQFNSKGEFPALINWARSKGISGNPNFVQQLDFIIDIIKNRPNLNILLNQNITPTEASFIWGSQFERFAGDNKRDGFKNRNDSHHKRRANRANKIYETYG